MAEISVVSGAIPGRLGAQMTPATIYINWAAYDELSDQVELTEAMALRQLDELLRLRASGMKLDYYMMDAFWYAPDGGYRRWRRPHWSNEGEVWLNRCQENGVLPGLWFGSNTIMDFCKVAPIPAWEDSLNSTRTAACFFEGNFWPHVLETYAYWYDRGVRLYKIDFSNLNAATPAAERKYLPSEIARLNLEALVAGISEFRRTHPEARFIGYNGLWEGFSHVALPRLVDLQTGTSVPSRKVVNLRLLDAFDTIYCGDPRPADLPAMNFWRSKDIYTDHMVRVFLENEVPMERLDNAGFMVGTTGTCYFRGTAAWQGMGILAYARGGALTTVYGNLDLLDEAKAQWFARVQALFLPFRESGTFGAFGGWPGEGKPYGYWAQDDSGWVVTAVNPGQNVAVIPWPKVAEGSGQLLFADAGFNPQMDSAGLTLGPEQMGVVGFGHYANPDFDLGRQLDVRIPQRIQPIAVPFSPLEQGRIFGKTIPAEAGRWRVTLQQIGSGGFALRQSGGAPPAGVTMGNLIQITADQSGQPLPVEIQYDKAIWSGLSWACAEFVVAAGEPVEIGGISSAPDLVALVAEVFRVED